MLESTQLEEFLNAKVGQTTKVWEVIFNNLISGSRSWAETQIFHTNSARRTCWNLSRSLLDCYVLRSLVSETHKNIRHRTARHSWRVRGHSHCLKLSHFSCFKGPRPPLTQPYSALPGLTRNPRTPKNLTFFQTVLETPLFPDFGAQSAQLEPQGSPKASNMEPTREPKTELVGYQGRSEN